MEDCRQRRTLTSSDVPGESLVTEVMQTLDRGGWNRDLATRIIAMVREHDRNHIADAGKMVTVCNKCLCASCWQGVFLCQDNKDAGIIELPVAALRAMNREHEEYWDKPTGGANV
jgi:hypothetical protein